MARKKLSQMSQTDGKIRKEEENNTVEYQPTTLSQLWGESTGSERYGTLNEEEYKQQISPENMNTAELRRHAIEVAKVVPTESRERLEKRLLLEFKKHVSGFTVPKVTHKPDKAPSKEVLKIMAEIKN